MGQSVKLSDDVMEAVRRESGVQSRSVAGQITHWLKIGRAIEQSPNFDYARVKEALVAAHSPDTLNGEEQEIWAAEFADLMTEPSAQEADFFAGRKQSGQGVGLDDSGALVTAESASKG
jgi:hypothetical protein